MKLNRKKEKAARYPGSGQNLSSSTDLNGLAGGKEKEKEKKGGEDVIIQWSHVEKSLGSTRSSISPQERRRLEAIYREFVVGRNGEMPNGEGGREVGGSRFR
jgi:peroxin-1